MIVSPLFWTGRVFSPPGIVEFDHAIEKGDMCIIRNNDRYLTLGIVQADGITIKNLVETGYGKVAKNLKNQRTSLTIRKFYLLLKSKLGKMCMM